MITGTRCLGPCTQIHPVTGQELHDLVGPVLARPVTRREWRRFVDLVGVRGRALFISLDDAATGTTGGFLIAAQENR